MLIQLAVLIQVGSAAVQGTAPSERVATESARPFVGVIAASDIAGVHWRPGFPALRWAPARSRYNRIEGISLAAIAGGEVGERSIVAGEVRLGSADIAPNATLELWRDQRRTERGLALYHSLASTAEWGDPLKLGASLGALIIGRDEGFYYRRTGVSGRVAYHGPLLMEGRVFVEAHRSAALKNDFSLADLFGSHSFAPNIQADEGTIAGGALSLIRRHEDESSQARSHLELRIEGGSGSFTYARGMLEGMTWQPLAGALLVGVRGAVGRAVGEVPAQRQWYLGGTRSIRGERSGAYSGDTFWLTQLELGPTGVFFRPIVFADFGWAGDDISAMGRIGRGFGAGAMLLDGSLRFEIARGVSTRVLLYLDW